MSLPKQLATNAISWEIGWHSALGTQEPQGQGPSLPSQWFNRTEAAYSSQPTSHTDNHHGAIAKGATGCGSEYSLVDTRTIYSALTSYFRAFSSQICTVVGATGKTITKRSTQALLVARMDKYFPTRFWWSLSVLFPYWEEIRLCLWNLSAITVQIEDALKLSFGGKLTIFTSHQVKQLLNGKGHLWMSHLRILRYQAVLMENSSLIIPLLRFLTQLPSCLPMRALSPFTLA